VEALRHYSALAAELGVAPSTLAIAWCLRNPNVSTVMLGASKLSQLLQNFEALDLWQRFDDATWQRIEASLA
jgi:aryl-alcohol dehydrogenase-like predicted oxidoreductase